MIAVASIAERLLLGEKRLESSARGRYVYPMMNGRKRSMVHPAQRVELGQYIVADPKICHGGVTFKGTRIFVADVLADVERGLSWDFIIERWGGGRLRKEAITEALQLARRCLLTPDRKLVPHALPTVATPVA